MSRSRRLAIVWTVMDATRPRSQGRPPWQRQLANRAEGKIDERPNFCRRLAARRIEGVKWKRLVRPIGKQVDQLPGVQILFRTDRNHLGDSRAGKTLGDHRPTSLTRRRLLADTRRTSPWR